jgi:hypothetical protein
VIKAVAGKAVRVLAGTPGMSCFRTSQTVHFSKTTCAACPLREQCTNSRNGRSVSIHPDEALLAELRQRQQTPAGRSPPARELQPSASCLTR